MKYMDDDKTEWSSIDLPENLVKALDDSDEVIVIGLADDGDKHRIILGCYGAVLENMSLYQWGMMNILKQQMDAAAHNTAQTKGVIKLLQERALELEQEIDQYVAEIKDDADGMKVIHDMTGLLGSCMGQLRALHGIKFDEDDVFSGPNVKELEDEAQADSDPDPAAGDDGAGAESDRSGEADEPEHG